MHQLQKILLKRLHAKNNQRFANLTRGYSFDDNVVFHLKQLASKGLVKKTSDLYGLTASGVKTITQYDLDNLDDPGLKTFFIGFLCQHGDAYLLKAHPSGTANFYNVPSGKPHFGESINDALVRLFKHVSGLTLPAGAFTFYSLHLKTVKTPAGETLFDDAFAIYNVALPVHSKLQLGKNIIAANINEIRALPNRWPEIDITILTKNSAPYMVYDVTSDYIL